jgi:hypothetical protein
LLRSSSSRLWSVVRSLSLAIKLSLLVVPGGLQSNNPRLRSISDVAVCFKLVSIADINKISLLHSDQDVKASYCYVLTMVCKITIRLRRQWYSAHRYPHLPRSGKRTICAGVDSRNLKMERGEKEVSCHNVASSFRTLSPMLLFAWITTCVYRHYGLSLRFHYNYYNRC